MWSDDLDLFFLYIVFYLLYNLYIIFRLVLLFVMWLKLFDCCIKVYLFLFWDMICVLGFFCIEIVLICFEVDLYYLIF